MKIGVVLAGLLAAVALVSGCGGQAGAAPATRTDATPAAAKGCVGKERAGWQALANRINAPVFCPSWMPDPFRGILNDHQWNTIYSVSPQDHSYLMGFIWLEPGSGELHVNLRGYPHRTKIPKCTDTELTGGKIVRSIVACFDDPAGTGRIAGRTFTVYTRNRDADLWHVLYAWHYKGGLYTLSQHVAEPLTYEKVVADLNRMMRGLQVVDPTS
jgi:hypothetical protein